MPSRLSAHTDVQTVSLSATSSMHVLQGVSFSTTCSVGVHGISLVTTSSLDVQVLSLSTASSVKKRMMCVCIPLHPLQCGRVGCFKAWACRVYPSPPPALWMCRVYPDPSPAVWTCSVYPSPSPAVWMCRVYPHHGQSRSFLLLQFFPKYSISVRYRSISLPDWTPLYRYRSVRYWNKKQFQYRNKSGSDIKGPSLVLKSYGTRLRCQMQECPCHWH